MSNRPATMTELTGRDFCGAEPLGGLTVHITRPDGEEEHRIAVTGEDGFRCPLPHRHTGQHAGDGFTWWGSDAISGIPRVDVMLRKGLLTPLEANDLRTSPVD